jgi:hypothetical protein
MRLGLGLGLGTRRGSAPPAAVAIGDLVGWWRVDASKVTLASTKVDSLDTYGGPVLPASQSNDVVRPTWQADHGDGAPAIAFNGGIPTRLTYTAITGLANANFTTIWLFKKTSGNGAIWCQSNTAISNTSVWCGGIGTTTYSAAVADAGGGPEVTQAGFTDATWHIITMRRSGNTWGVRLNEGTEATAVNAMGTATTNQAFIGSLMNAAVPAHPLTGHWREGLIYTAYKSDADQLLVRDAIRAYWPSI